MRPAILLSILVMSVNPACTGNSPREQTGHSATGPVITETIQEPEKPAVLGPRDIIIEKDITFEKYTLEDTYPYQDSLTREFQWDKMKEMLAMLENAQSEPCSWVVIRNKANVNGVAPLVKDDTRNEYGNVSDRYGVERRQSAPLYNPSDPDTPERYGRDGTLLKFMADGDGQLRASSVYFEGEWLIPDKFAKKIDTVRFDKVVFVDRTNQNIATLERSGDRWLVRSMNPATTGRHNPPYAHETPLGIFAVQEKKEKMIYYRDGTTDYGGFAPYATRFCSGAYIHGVPVNAPGSQIIEYSQTLGTTPRSHMCVRNATSHAKFVYDWAPVDRSLVMVIE